MKEEGIFEIFFELLLENHYRLTEPVLATIHASLDCEKALLGRSGQHLELRAYFLDMGLMGVLERAWMQENQELNRGILRITNNFFPELKNPDF